MVVSRPFAEARASVLVFGAGTPGPVRVLRLARPEACLAERRRLLVARERVIGTGRPKSSGASHRSGPSGPNLGRRRRHDEREQLFVPGEAVDVEEEVRLVPETSGVWTAPSVRRQRRNVSTVPEARRLGTGAAPGTASRISAISGF
jgi:hypothetical protein